MKEWHLNFHPYRHSGVRPYVYRLRQKNTNSRTRFKIWFTSSLFWIVYSFYLVFSSPLSVILLRLCKDKFLFLCILSKTSSAVSMEFDKSWDTIFIIRIIKYLAKGRNDRLSSLSSIRLIDRYEYSKWYNDSLPQEAALVDTKKVVYNSDNRGKKEEGRKLK